MNEVLLVREFAMPNSETFEIPAIKRRISEALLRSIVSVDPFARNRREATWTNDINPNTRAEYHMEARDFLRFLSAKGVRADLLLLDPPYSPTQIKRAYQSAGLHCSSTDTQNAALVRECRDLMTKIAAPGATAIVCGWNSLGMCAPWIRREVLLVNHGGQHNDTIVTTCQLPTSPSAQGEPAMNNQSDARTRHRIENMAADCASAGCAAPKTTSPLSEPNDQTYEH